MKSVPDLLRDAAAIYEHRNAIYGDNYKNIGAAFVALYPHGVELRTADDFNRFALFTQCLGKLSRYAQQFASGGHADSLDDLSVYAMMLREIDEEADLPAWPHETTTKEETDEAAIERQRKYEAGFRAGPLRPKGETKPKDDWRYGSGNF